MKTRLLILRCSCASLVTGSRPRCRVRPPPTPKLNVVTTTEDLASLAREVGGDRITVESIARGYQDPHFVEAKPSFILKLQKAGSADRGRPRTGDRLAAAAHPAEPQREGAGRRGRLPRRVTGRADPRDPDRARSPAPWATCTRRAIRTTGSTPRTAGSSPRAIADKLVAVPARTIARTSISGSPTSARGSPTARKALAGADGAVQGHEGGAPTTGRSRTSPTASASTSSATSSRARASRRVPQPHARSDPGDEAPERQAGPGRAVLRPQDARIRSPGRPARRCWSCRRRSAASRRPRTIFGLFDYDVDAARQRASRRRGR